MDAAVRRPGGRATHGAVAEKSGEKCGLDQIAWLLYRCQVEIEW